MTLDIIPDPRPIEEPEFESHAKTTWIISIDAWGAVSVLKYPNIHPGFLEATNAEELGIPYELPEELPGVYVMECVFYEHHDWETGICDDWGFECETLTPILVHEKDTEE